MSKKYIQMGPTAENIPFDNTGHEDCFPTAETVDEALKELCDKTNTGGLFPETLYWANCVCHCDAMMFSDFEPLADYTYNAIKVEDC